MCDDLGARFLGQASRASEMVWVGVADEDRMDVLDRHARLAQAVLEGTPSVGAGEPGVDDGRPVLIQNRKTVDVPEPRKPDGKLHPQDVWSHLGDFGASVFLLLSSRHAATLLDRREVCMSRIGRCRPLHPGGDGAQNCGIFRDVRAGKMGNGGEHATAASGASGNARSGR